MITYTLDSSDHLTAIGGGWQEFARSNNGNSLTEEEILGRPLFDFIHGAEIRQIYKSIFTKVRETGRALKFTFRCDAPDMRRSMEINIAPLPDGGLEIRTDLLTEEPRRTVPVLEPDVPRTMEILPICCICGSVQSEAGYWVPLEEGCARLGLFESSCQPQLSHGYCPTCFAEQLKLVQST